MAVSDHSDLSGTSGCRRRITGIVTTASSETPELISRALLVSKKINLPYIGRNNKGIKKLAKEYGVTGVIVVSAKRISFHLENKEFFYHPGMAKLRIKEMLKGKTDQMVKSMDICPGDAILDCTLGLGSDALVASYAAGPYGTVTGLESSLLIELLVREGLAEMRDEGETLMTRAAERITTLNSHHLEFLTNTPDGTYDTVYFDPMFRHCIKGSPYMDAMRPLTDHSPLNRLVLQEALRVCRKRVVVKEKKGSTEFTRLGIHRVDGGKYSPVAFGIIIKRGGGHG